MSVIPTELPPLSPRFDEQNFGAGCANSSGGETDCYIILAMFDHDYLGWHALVQHWDHRTRTEWNYGLVLTCREFNWETRLVHDYGTARPSTVEIAGTVDMYLECPYLRFLLRG